MDTDTKFTEDDVQALVTDKMSVINEHCEGFDDWDSMKAIVQEALISLSMTILKRHYEEIRSVQEMYFNQTKLVNDRTITILKELVDKSTSR